jgi:hypothetical protein
VVELVIRHFARPADMTAPVLRRRPPGEVRFDIFSTICETEFNQTAFRFTTFAGAGRSMPARGGHTSGRDADRDL